MLKLIDAMNSTTRLGTFEQMPAALRKISNVSNFYELFYSLKCLSRWSPDAKRFDVHGVSVDFQWPSKLLTN
jgi:hypothetical protein